MIKERIIRENNYSKTVQYTNTIGRATSTYCINYRKVFHRDYKDGFKWVQC